MSSRAWWVVGLLCWGLGAACVVPESVGYVQSLPGSGLGEDDNNGGQRPDTGACVVNTDCAPTQECCRGTCVGDGRCPMSAMCSTQGQICELAGGSSFEDQGDFICAALSGTQPVCLEKCEEVFAASNCAPTSYCFEVGAGSELLQICVPSECAGSLECEDQTAYGGTCIGFGNETGFCFPAGTAQRGEPCDPASPSPATTCSPDLFCVQDAVGAQCRTLCDMWNPAGNRCGDGEVCGYLTAGQGVCVPQTATGRAPFEECTPEGDWCEDGVACLDFGTGGESLVVCVAYCRPERPDDCRGPRFGGREPVCQAVFVNGRGEPVTDIGVCL